MKCTLCNKPIILIPSASERALKLGGKASDYTALFTEHAACVVEKRSADATALLISKGHQLQANKVVFPLNRQSA
jgi:hypothetical protein